MLLTAIGLLIVVVIHTAIATIMIRFFRVRLKTRWGVVVFAVMLIPVVLVLSLLVLGQLPIFRALDRNTVLTVTIVLPIVLGLVIDLFWLPSPAEVARQLDTEQ